MGGMPADFVLENRFVAKERQTIEDQIERMVQGHTFKYSNKKGGKGCFRELLVVK